LLHYAPSSPRPPGDGNDGIIIRHTQAVTFQRIKTRCTQKGGRSH
jgi:hypothetical protein